MLQSVCETLLLLSAINHLFKCKEGLRHNVCPEIEGEDHILWSSAYAGEINLLINNCSSLSCVANCLVLPHDNE